MNTITQLSDKNYAITKEVIDSMLIQNPSELLEFLSTIIPRPVDPASVYLLSGCIADSEGDVSAGFALYNGNLVRVYGGAFTGFYQYIDSATLIQGVDEFSNPYKTEIHAKRLEPAQSGIDYQDMIRIEIAIIQQFKSNPSISAGLNSRFLIGASNCHITQFGRVQFDVDYVESDSIHNTSITAGWNAVHTIPTEYRSTADIDVYGTAIMTHGTVTKIVPVKIVAGVLQFYEEDGFTTSDFILNVRLNYSL